MVNGAVWEPPTASHKPAYPVLSFITFHSPNEARDSSRKTRVKSHAATYGNRVDGTRQISQSDSTLDLQFSGLRGTSRKALTSRRRRRKRRDTDIVLDVDVLSLVRDTESNEHYTSSFERELGWIMVQLSSPVNGMLGEGRVDPFRTYPVPFEPNIPVFVDHYLMHMAIDIPELDAGTPGLLRSKWFPLCMTEAPLFHVIMLLAASNYTSVRCPRRDGPNLLQLKSRAIASINEALKNANSSVIISDQLIGAVAKMASYEAMYGDQQAFTSHMRGLLQMIDLRGGLLELGLGGLLERICIWIDSNSAFLHNSPVYFTSSQVLSPRANPSGFLAAY